MPYTVLYLITALLYAGLTVAALTRMRRPAGPREGTSALAPALDRAGTPLALLLHALLLHQALFAPEGTNLHFGVAMSLIAWLVVAIYWMESFWYPLGVLRLIVLPPAALAVLLPLLMPAQHLLAYSGMPLFTAHLVLSMVAYSLITIAAVHAGLAWVLESRLHAAGSVPTLLRGLPPLMSLERLAFRILGLGFALLTLTVVSGVFFSEALFGKPFTFTHKVLFGVLAWLVFALLLAGRHWRGWRGRTAMRWTLAGFAFLMLAYVGSKFVLEILLHRV